MNMMKNTRAAKLKERSRLRRENEKLDLRRNIIDTAASLFVEKGYEDLSMRQIAERIGYSATTIYRFYDNKDALLSAIVDEGFKRFGKDLAASLDGKDGTKGMRALGYAYVDFGLKNPAYYRLMFMQRADLLFEPRPDEPKAPIDSFGILNEAVKRAMDAGFFAQGDSLTVSKVIWAMMHGITSLALADGTRFNRKALDQVVELSLRMIKKGLSPD
jgi:AcrR family transcriptional regulator